ncbi:uncharacterized protein isoform X2 [Choristoneura fumiferana]|uniref:uncharacterized protein isoform X2 n=1 Tax=Choristoneura fumiferana TaxID=7141 RepID=UPI003D155FEF
MASSSRATPQNMSKYRITRRGRKLQVSDDQRTLIALPKDVPERTWAEILQKEENELIVLDVREELLEQAMRIGYEHYMERQTTCFTAHCAALAWLKLIDWYFYRHDPGEDPSAYPPCYIPKRRESWMPDQLPDPSPKDTWGQQNLPVLEETCEEDLKKCPSSSSIDYPVVEEIPVECRFPGKVRLPGMSNEALEYSLNYEDSESPSSDLAADSELLQKVVDYSTEELSIQMTPQESTLSALKTTTPVEGSLHGAGDSTLQRPRKRASLQKSKIFSHASVQGRSRATLPPLMTGDSHSHISAISDCRLRNLRLDTQYEVSSEKMDTPPGEVVKRKS